jgi:glutathione synthase/RimK-type ligase-like ATP-grasp enzyme
VAERRVFATPFRVPSLGKPINMILVVTEADDRTATQVIAKLHERGAEVARFNPADFPSRASVSIGLAAAATATLTSGAATIDLHRLDALWYRRPQPPVAHDEVRDPKVRRYLEAECAQYLLDTWNLLHCRFVPAAPAVIARAELKASQLAIAKSAGFELPPTLVSNSPDEMLDFYLAHNGQIVSKLPGPAFNRHLGESFARYTEVVARRDLGYAASIRFGPAIFQAYVPKRVELRITVVGQRVFAAEIHSQANSRTQHDWRRYDLSNTPHLAHELPSEVQRCCLRLVEQLGLCYGAIDMVLTPDGRYVFLEINPNGQYLWIESLTGLPISDAICDLLMAPASVRQRPACTQASCIGATS